MVDEHYNLKGLITVKDIQKKLKYPNAAKDDQGRLRVRRGARRRRAISWSARRSWSRKKVDVLAIDTAHGHSERVMDAIEHLQASIARSSTDRRQCRAPMKARAI